MLRAKASPYAIGPSGVEWDADDRNVDVMIQIDHVRKARVGSDAGESGRDHRVGGTVFRRPLASRFSVLGHIAAILGPMEFEVLEDSEASRLYELDRTHWLHPQGDLDAPAGTIPQLMFAGGRGATLTDVHGREYIDGMASLWNVNVGYGRSVLADAAAAQMKKLAFSSAYGGFGTAPAIELAAKLAELAPGDLDVTYFASGGAEANDTAYKIARLYWKMRGGRESSSIEINGDCGA